MDVLRRVLEVAPPNAETLRAWWDATATERARPAATIDRALAGGALADRLGFAFAGGYSEALRALVPGLSGITALCATEEGGNRPRAIKTVLAPLGDGRYVVRGKKKWATVGGEASVLLVVASTGEVDGKNRLRVVRVPADAKLVASTVPFVPEIPHAEIELDGVEVSEADLLPGDGYDEYLKPFRTVEDLHVHAALAGYLIGVARRHELGHEPIQKLLAIASAVRSLAAADRGAPSTHLALAGLIELATTVAGEVEQRWSKLGGDEHARWQRDRSLLKVASSARVARGERAWQAITGIAR
jgi:alkylation response protein AidB-like acyl-CoA dehydrogenase